MIFKPTAPHKIQGGPIGGLMDPRFVYVPAEHQTVERLRATFERIRAEMALKGK